jgi:hypothetical protein
LAEIWAFRPSGAAGAPAALEANEIEWESPGVDYRFDSTQSDTSIRTYKSKQNQRFQQVGSAQRVIVKCAK